MSMRKLSAVILLIGGLVLSDVVSAAGFSLRYERIPSFDNVEIAAVVIQPEGQGPGPFPLIVMPSSWAVLDLEYVGRGAVLASQGYIVVSYTSRGFWDSQGLVDIAGSATVEDVSALIDWALTHTPANPNAIGASGISYGAGISLLAAQRDPRIKAVAALSGWADLGASLYANQTFSLQGAAVLVAGGIITGRAGPDLAEINRRFVMGNFDGAANALLQIAPERNPAIAPQSLDGTAVLLANAYGDALFPPGQYIDFFNHLQGPKRLLLAHGDHTTVELPGALGLPNEVYGAVGRWFDRYLKHIDNGVDGEWAVQLKSQTGHWRSYPDWNAVQAGEVTYSLTKPTGLLLPTGGLSPTMSTGWSYDIHTGVPTVADSGIAFISGALQGYLQLPSSASMPLVLRAAAGVWTGPMYWNRRHLTGMSQLRVTVTPYQADTTLFAYLYDVDLLGTGQLITHKPYRLRDKIPGVAQTIDVHLEGASWEIAAGHRLVLVIDTLDPRYVSISPLGGRVEFSSPVDAPSTLTVPLH